MFIVILPRLYITQKSVFKQRWGFPAILKANTNLIFRNKPNLSLFADMKELAAESLGLLKAAIFDARFPALFSLKVYGSIIGLFELNNLSE